MFRRWWNNQLWRLCAGYFCDAVAANMLGPLLVMSMVARAVDPATIGAIAALLPLASIASLFATPRLVGRFGVRQVFLLALVVGGLATIGFALTTQVLLWALLAVAAGLSSGVRYVLAESAVSLLAPPEARGRSMALFQTVIGASLFVASGLLMLVGATTVLPFLMMLVALIGALLIIRTLPLPALAERQERARGRLHIIAQVGPLVLIAAFLSGLFEAGTGTAMPLYGISSGLSATFATALVTMIGLGSFFQYPFGALADRFPLRHVMLATACITVLGALLLPLAHALPMILWGLSFVWGSLGGGLYTLATIKIGGAFRGAQLVAASSVAQFAYTIGSMIGPAVGGLAIELSPDFGMAITFAGIGLIGLIAMVFLTERKHYAAPEPTATVRATSGFERIGAGG